MKKTLVAAAAVGALLASMGGADAADALKLKLKWVPQAQFAGYFVAASKGYYTDANLDVTIDGDAMPYKVLLIRGTVRLDEVEGIAPEYEAMTLRVMGEAAGRAWLANLAPLCPRMARIFIRPAWVGILDFEARFPSAIERAMARAAGATPT